MKLTTANLIADILAVPGGREALVSAMPPQFEGFWDRVAHLSVDAIVMLCPGKLLDSEIETIKKNLDALGDIK